MHVGGSDTKDWLERHYSESIFTPVISRNAADLLPTVAAFFIVFAIILGLITAFCIYALHRGPNRHLFPCWARRARARKANAALRGGSGAGAEQFKDGGAVYQADLKRARKFFGKGEPDLPGDEGGEGGRYGQDVHVPNPKGPPSVNSSSSSDSSSVRSSTSQKPLLPLLNPLATLDESRDRVSPLRAPKPTRPPLRVLPSQSIGSSPLRHHQDYVFGGGGGGEGGEVSKPAAARMGSPGGIVGHAV